MQMDKRVQGKENRGNRWKGEGLSFSRGASSLKCQIPADRGTKVPCCEWSRSMGTTRRVRQRLRPDRVLLGALRFPAFTSSRNRLSPCDDGERQPLSLDSHIRRLPVTLHNSSMSIHTPRFHDDVATDISI